MKRRVFPPGVSPSLPIALALTAFFVTSPAGTDQPRNRQHGQPTRRSIKKARAIHDRVIALDTHDDIAPANFTAEKNYTQRLDTQVNLPKMIEGGLDASFFIVYVGQGELTPAALRQGVHRCDREVRGDSPADEDDRAGQDRAGADRGRRDAHREERQEGRADRRRKRLSDRRQDRAREGIPRPRRALSVDGPQRPQPAGRLEHRRTRRQVDAQRPEPARQAGGGGSEQVRDHARSVASVEGGEPADDRAVEGAGDRVAFERPRDLRSQPEHGRRAAARAEEERRRGADGRVQQLREDAQARFARARRGNRRDAQGDGPSAGHRSWRRRRRGRRRDASVDRRAARRIPSRSSRRSTRSSPAIRARRSPSSSITSTTPSRRSASTTSASPPTSTEAAASTAGTTRAKRST